MLSIYKWKLVEPLGIPGAPNGTWSEVRNEVKKNFEQGSKHEQQCLDELLKRLFGFGSVSDEKLEIDFPPVNSYHVSANPFSMVKNIPDA